jgi:hypothetical protein
MLIGEVPLQAQERFDEQGNMVAALAEVVGPWDEA